MEPWIEETLHKFKDAGSFDTFGILGYKNSKGRYKDYLLKPLTPDGYLQLVQASYDELEERGVGHLCFAGIKESNRANLLTQLKKSFKESLAKTPEEKRRDMAYLEYRSDLPDNVALGTNGDCIYLMRLLTVVCEASDKGPKPSPTTDYMTARNRLPVGHYIHQLKLDGTEDKGRLVTYAEYKQWKQERAITSQTGTL